LRLVKSGEEIEIRERGVPVARLTSIKKESVLAITPARKDPASLSKYRFSVKPKSNFDVVDMLLEDRAKR
jgi:antitoxin (DNA-binding transcriptional repressor) of toxin-antitoxin stability system